MSTEQHSNFYEAEFSEIKVSHSDFSVEDKDYVSERKEVNDYLLSQNWDSVLSKHDKMVVDTDLRLLNEIFDEIFERFSKKIDTVELFDIVTDFFDLNAEKTFKKLVSKNRKLLLADLEKRIGQLRINKLRGVAEEDNSDLTIKSVFSNL